MNTSSSSSLFVDRDDQWPPGFRFHPTDEELILYYLKRKICRRRLKLNVIADIDVYKQDPDELPGLSKLKTGDRQWFFFSPRDRKYPNGGRSNRATRLGYWKATGKDRIITCNSRTVGIKKTLVFYKGRAPSGERTDWVMHEYTLDEEELKRCPAQDYYALYKVFKKSGPGPKNGEQYGAPFREEDWVDDEKEIVSVGLEQAPLQQCSPHASLDNTQTNCEAQLQISSLDEFLNQIANDPLFESLPEAFDHEQVAGRDEETQTTVVDQSLVEANVHERGIASYGHFNDVQPCFNLTQSASSQFQGISEVTFDANMSRQGSHESGEDFFEDFLELDDLICPQLANQNSENHVDEFRIEDFDGLCELDLFDDVSMFLQGEGDTELTSGTHKDNVGNRLCNTAPISCPNNLMNGTIDYVPNIYFNSFQTETVQPIPQPYHNSLSTGTVNQFSYQMPNVPDVATQQWMKNQNFSMATQALSNQESVVQSTSGVGIAGVNQNQNQNAKSNEGGESWFSSTLWSFVETIPTTPASAAESTALVNKAFERLSSFSLRGESVKVNLLMRSVNAGNPTASRRRSQNMYNRGVLLFSVLGVLCAALWAFAGPSIR